MTPFPDQIAYLKEIKRVSLDCLEELFNQTGRSKESYIPVVDGKLKIALSNSIRINSHAIPFVLINFLKEQLNFANSAFIIKKKSGRSTFETPGFLN